MKYLIMKLGGSDDDDREAKVERFADKMASTIAKALVDDDLTPMDLMPTLTLLEARCKSECLKQIDECRDDDGDNFEFN